MRCARMDGKSATITLRTVCPPGQWIGTAPEALGLSGEVSEAHMHTLFGQKFTPIETVEVAEMLHGLPQFDDYMGAYNTAYAYREHACGACVGDPNSRRERLEPARDCAPVGVRWGIR